MQTQHVDLLKLGLIVVGALYVGYHLRRQTFTTPSSDGPILSSGEMLQTTGLTAVNKGTMAGFDYNIMTNDAGSVMVYVQLGHDTDMHILAYGDKAGTDGWVGPVLPKKYLTRVMLEGDFPDYFRLYCSPEKEVEIRQVFGPDTMAEFADFCQAYNFEIYRETLFVSKAFGSHDSNDTTSLVTDLEQFLTQHSQLFARL